MLYYFALFSIFTSFLIAIYNWKVEKNALLIAGILAILSTYALTHYLTDPTKSDYILAITYGTLSPLWLLPGPLIYFYVRNIVEEKNSYSKKDLLHIIPSLIHLINVIPYLLKPFSYKLYVAHMIHQNLYNIKSININALYPFEFAYLSRPIVLMVYIIWTAFLLKRSFNVLVKKTKIWLLTFIGILLITTSTYLWFSIHLLDNSYNVDIINSLPIYYASGFAYTFLPIVLILFFPQVLYGQRIQLSNKPTNDIIKIPQKDYEYYQKLANEITEHLSTNKPYLSTKFEISDIANSLNVPQQHISFACKNILNKKFTDLRNQLRIEHAKQLLLNGEMAKITIDGIGNQSGFKSRSTFYEAFKTRTGMKPTQFLEKEKS